MAIIQTERNRVFAHEPDADDVFVRASFLVQGDAAGTLTPHHLRYLPISEYQAVVDWAVSMADQMAYPIHVLPLSYDDMLAPSRIEPFRAAVARMDDQERGAMRALVVTTCAEVMRDCDEVEVREEAFSVLSKMGVVDQ